MICSRCGTNVPNGSPVCPRCGNAMAYQQPQNYGQPAVYGGYPQSAYAPPPAAYRRPKAAPNSSPLSFVPLFMLIIAVFSSLGIFAMPICKYDHVDTCLNMYLSEFIRVGGDEIECKFLKTMLIVGLVVIGITVILAIIAAVMAGKRNAPAALNVCAIALFLNAAAYIANFALFLHANGDDHDDEADMAAAPIVMILLCIGMAILSLYAARLAKREANS